MVNLTIDGRQISVEENTTIMEAARSVGIQIPSLCYLKGINEIGACRVCVVELEGKDRLITACNNICKEGMVIYTNSPKVRKDRRTTVELILSEHDCQCVTCMRSGNCSLQKIANDLDIIELPFHQYLEHQSWDKTFPLIRDSAKCIKCMRCVQVCDKVQGLGVWDVEGTGYHTTVNVSGHNSIREADCALCGQCITHCPVGALRERSDTNEVWRAIEDPDKIVVAQVAPAVRAAACAHHALHRAFGGHDAGQRGVHQQLHRRAVPAASRVHRVHGYAPGLSRAREGNRTRHRPGTQGHEAASRHAAREHGRPATHERVRDDRGAPAHRHPHGRLPLRLLASAPPDERAENVPRPRGGRGALRLLVAL